MDNMAAKHFTPKNISGKRIEDFDFEEFISRKNPEKYQRSPFLADKEFYRTYSNHDEKCYNRTQKDIPLQKKLYSKDACVQVSLEDLQSYKRINEYNLYDHQENINFEETEKVIHGTCKYCQKPLSASDFECESTFINDPLMLVGDFRNQYGGMKSIPKYAHTCHDNPQNPYEEKFWDTSRVNEYLPRFQSSRPQLEHFCHEHCSSCIPRVPDRHQEVCSNEVCCSREITSNPYHLQYNIKPFDRNKFTDNKCYLPHRSKAVLYYNSECSCSKSLESRDNMHRFEPICNLHCLPETSMSLANKCNNFHKIRNAKYYMENSKVSDYPTPPQNNTCKHKVLDKSRDNMQTPCDFNFCFDSQQTASWKSSPNYSSRYMLKRSEGIVSQLNCHRENSSDMADNMHLSYTSEDTQKRYPKELQSIDIKAPTLIQNINKSNKSNSHEQIVKEKSNMLIQRTDNVNIQRRYRNREVMDDIYNKADNVLEELKKVLIKKGKWNGK